jgi:hypothetical protein
MALEPLHSGEVHDVRRYWADLVLVASDRVPGYDVILPDADPRSRLTGRTRTGS